MRTTLAIIALIAPAIVAVAPETGVQPNGDYRVVNSVSYQQMCEDHTVTELDEYTCKLNDPYA